MYGSIQTKNYKPNRSAMRKEINTSVTIHASAEKVWRILMDFEQYPNWNPFIRSISGRPEPGGRITVRIEPPGARGMSFRPRVLQLEANKSFRWLGHLLFPGLFDGEHGFELTDNGNGTTTFRQSEKFSGLLVPLFKKMLDHNTVKGFQLMNEKLKEGAEAVAVQFEFPPQSHKSTK